MNKSHILNKGLWLKAMAIVVLQGFVLSNIATVESLSIDRILSQNKHLRKQNPISLSHRVPFGEQKITDLCVLLPGLEEFQFSIQQDRSESITLRKVIEEQPYDGYTFPVFNPSKYTKEVRKAQYEIAFGNGDKALKAQRIERLWSDTDAAVLLPDTLLNHAQREWEIIVKLVNGDFGFGDVLGNPYLDPEKILTLYREYFGDEFRGLKDNNMTVNFIAHLLLLHDLGKRDSGESGHEERSVEILNELFKDDYFGFLRSEKNLLQQIVGFHSRIGKIGKSAKDYEDFQLIIEETVREGFFTERQLLDILQIWIVFRISERLQSQHFGFIEADYFEKLKGVYDIAKKVIREFLLSYETQQKFQRLPKPISNSI